MELQDDDVVDSLSLFLSLYEALQREHLSIPLDASLVLRQVCSPGHLLFFLARHIHFDHLVLSDWLLSLDTNILEFLVG